MSIKREFASHSSHIEMWLHGMPRHTQHVIHVDTVNAFKNRLDKLHWILNDGHDMRGVYSSFQLLNPSSLK